MPRERRLFRDGIGRFIEVSERFTAIFSLLVRMNDNENACFDSKKWLFQWRRRIDAQDDDEEYCSRRRKTACIRARTLSSHRALSLNLSHLSVYPHTTHCLVCMHLPCIKHINDNKRYP